MARRLFVLVVATLAAGAILWWLLKVTGTIQFDDVVAWAARLEGSEEWTPTAITNLVMVAAILVLVAVDEGLAMLLRAFDWLFERIARFVFDVSAEARPFRHRPRYAWVFVVLVSYALSVAVNRAWG